MSPPVFVIDPDALAGAAVGDAVVLEGSEGRHAVTVTRMQPGEALDLVDGCGRRVRASVASTSGKETLVATVVRVEDETPPGVTFTAVQAIPKGDRGELAVELLTEAGVDSIVPWAAERCVVRWRAERLQKSHSRWVEASVAAAKQSRRARPPAVRDMLDTAGVAALIGGAATAVVLDEESSHAISDVPLPLTGEVVVVIGPEGGIAPQERQAFEDAGAVSVRMGPHVLRTSTAGVVALAVLMSGTERWSLPDGFMEG